MSIPEKIDYLIIGAGIHGLSTAWHLAKKLKAKGIGDGSNILVLDKGKIKETGTHTELIALGGLYNRIYELQIRPQDSKLYEISEMNLHPEKRTSMLKKKC